MMRVITRLEGTSFSQSSSLPMWSFFFHAHKHTHTHTLELGQATKIKFILYTHNLCCLPVSNCTFQFPRGKKIEIKKLN